tara:strand:- start:333 stop:524 length:192 start_codon:yes stop_codon:yes gene_type:complete
VFLIDSTKHFAFHGSSFPYDFQSTLPPNVLPTMETIFQKKILYKYNYYNFLTRKKEKMKKNEK